jgi:hypothetical protein
MTTSKTFCLFDGRHPLPTNLGAIYTTFDFDTFSGIKTPCYFDAIDSIKSGMDVSIIVTGLTPALTGFISDAIDAAKGNNYLSTVTLLHYNNVTADYVPQIIW